MGPTMTAFAGERSAMVVAQPMQTVLDGTVLHV
jgi:hypothetical protein